MINDFEEEVAIVHGILLQQRRVLAEFQGYLNPSSIATPSTARKIRFDFEKKSIERILVNLREQSKSCAELQKRARGLATQNVQSIEALQDDNSRAIFIITFITVLFLPLTFVAGYFCMNLHMDTSQTTSLYWKIAGPLAAAVLLLCFVVIKCGEWLFWILRNDE